MGSQTARTAPPQELIDALEERIQRQPAERYPVQHATAQFHLGVALANAGRLAEGETALACAARLFEGRLLVEHAKTLNALGAIFRMQGRPLEAADTFVRAAEEFEQGRQPRERGAALYNLGLVQRELGQGDRAVESFEGALGLIGQADPRAQAALLRELGMTLFQAGRLDEAGNRLRQALDLSNRIRDPVAIGGTANVLGLVELAGGRPTSAIQAFLDSLAANPRSIRPADYAMAKANLALAYQQAGSASHARLAAQQAIAVPNAPAAVRQQGNTVLENVGPGRGTVLEILSSEPLEHWPALARDEMARWLDLDEAERQRELEAWIAGQVGSDSEGDLAECLVGAMLELQPHEIERMATSLVKAINAQAVETANRFRQQLSTAMARFHPPQWERLRAIMNRVENELATGRQW